jgi:hypothetical protein
MYYCVVEGGKIIRKLRRNCNKLYACGWKLREKSHVLGLLLHKELGPCDPAAWKSLCLR